MKLSDLNIKDEAIVKTVNCDNVLKNRFYSFGIVKGAKITLEERTLTKSTIEVKINQTRIALRLSEASCIEVEK